MIQQQLESWIKSFGLSWGERNVDAVMKLFDIENLTYFESVFTPPLTSWDAVKKLWDVVPVNQKDITFTSDIVAVSETYGIIHWSVTRFFIPANATQHIDGIFQISLNDTGLCTFFKQWRMVK